MKILNSNEVNTGRQIEADIAKAICIVGMVLVHMYEEFEAPFLDTGFQNALVNVIQTLVGAPCFMFCMGLGISYTKNNSGDDLLKRGFQILLIGYTLNFVRGSILYPICAAIRHYPTSEIIYGTYIRFMENDILQFAGMALIIMGLLKKLKLDNKKILLVSVGLSIIGSFVRFVSVNPYLDYPLGLFIGTYDVEADMVRTYFPSFNWLIFVCAGNVYGDILKRVEDKKKFYGIFVPVFGVIVAIYLLFAIPNQIGMINPDLKWYYHLTTFDACFSIMSCVAILGIYYFISLVLPEIIKKFLTSVSRNINRIYCIHWVILYNASIFMHVYLEKDYLDSMLICNVAAICLFLFSYAMALLVEKRMKHGN